MTRNNNRENYCYKNMYGLYDIKTEECVFVGNIDEVSKFTHKKKDTIYGCLSRVKRVGSGKEKYEVVRLGLISEFND